MAGSVEPCPSTLEGEGARRADEGLSKRARSDWRLNKTPRLREFARVMRSHPTEAEAKCWALLRDRRLAEFKFRRQLPFGNFIADFVCVTAKLVIELDGSQHAESTLDVVRDAYFEKQGYRVLRVWNNEILRNPNAVLDTICRLVMPDTPASAQPTPHPSRPAADPPSPSRGEGRHVGARAAQR